MVISGTKNLGSIQLIKYLVVPLDDSPATIVNEINDEHEKLQKQGKVRIFEVHHPYCDLPKDITIQEVEEGQQLLPIQEYT